MPYMKTYHRFTVAEDGEVTFDDDGSEDYPVGTRDFVVVWSGSIQGVQYVPRSVDETRSTNVYRAIRERWPKLQVLSMT